jgi:ribose transport system substrate-binding protein
MATTIAVFTKSRINPAYAAARLGADRRARELGAQVVQYVPDKPENVAEQIAQIDEALERRHDAFVFVPVHPTAVNAAVRKVVAAGVPLVGYLNPFSEPGPLTQVISDDYTLALKITIFLCERLERRGSVVIVEGPPHSITSNDRVRGFRDGLARFPQMRISASICGEYDRDTARAVTAELIASDVSFDAVIAANDVMALGAIDALEAGGRKAVVIGVNAIPDAVTAIKQGKLLATSDFDAMNMAAIATEAAIRHLRGETVPKLIALPVQIVHAKNYMAWDKPFEERTLLDWNSVVT